MNNKKKSVVVLNDIVKKGTRFAVFAVMVLFLGLLSGCGLSSDDSSSSLSGSDFSGNSNISGSVVVNTSDANTVYCCVFGNIK